MKHALPTLVLASLVLPLAGCPDAKGLTLFVAPVNGETNVRLVDVEPNPF